MPINYNPFENIPTLDTKEAIASWLECGVRYSHSRVVEYPDTIEVSSFTLSDFSPKKLPPNKKFIDKFTLAVLLADWSCYADQANREDYAYLKNVFAVSPWGFRLWMAKLEGNSIPIGYTGFHPISHSAFIRIKNNPESITNRMQITPKSESISGKNYYYIYNIGIIKQFQRTTASKILIEALAKDLASANACGLAAIVVSPDGQRVSERFGLRQSGFITHEGHKEIAYVSEDTAVSQDV